MSIPGLIYLAMGAVVARILLDGTLTQGYRTMEWFTLAFNIARIIFLWPLVLFIDRFEGYLKQEPAAAVPAVMIEESAGVFEEPWQLDSPVPVPIPATGRE